MENTPSENKTGQEAPTKELHLMTKSILNITE